MTTSRSSLFKPLREWLLGKAEGGHKLALFFAKLIYCPFCTSVWVGIFLDVVFKVRLFGGNVWIDGFISSLVLAGLSVMVAGKIFRDAQTITIE